MPETANRSESHINRKCNCNTRAFHFYLESVEMLYVFVFAAKCMVKVMPL